MSDHAVLICAGLGLAVVGIVVVTIVSGPDALAPTGLRDLAVLLAGALAGFATAKGTSGK